MNNDKSKLIKGIIFQSEGNIPSSSFSDLNGDGYIKLGNKTYMYIWHDGETHQAKQLKITKEYDIINDRCFAISESNGQLDVNDINRVFSGEYSAYKPTIIAKSKKYFRDSINKEIKMNINQFNKIKDKAKRTNKSFVASMKDANNEDVLNKMKVLAEDYEKIDKQLTNLGKKYQNSTNSKQEMKVLFDKADKIQEDWNKYVDLLNSKSKYNISKINHYPGKNDYIKIVNSLKNYKDSKMKDSKVYIFKVKSTYGGDEGQKYINMIKADSIVNAWEKWKEQHSPGWANYLINEVRTDSGDYYPHLFGLPTSVDKKIKSTKWSAGDSIKDRTNTTVRQFRNSDLDEEGSWLGTTEWGTPKGSMYVYKKDGKIVVEAKGGSVGDPIGKYKFNTLQELNRWLLKFEDSIKDVEPNKDESKEEFIARFMNETKSEYPNEKQRYAVANSYWKKAKDSVGDGKLAKLEDLFGNAWSSAIHLISEEMNMPLKEAYTSKSSQVESYANKKGYLFDMNGNVYNSNQQLIKKNKYNDSIKDEDITELSQEEMRAIEDYKKAISNTKDMKLLNLYSHILREEIEHLEELNNAKSEVGDSTCKDKESAKVREYVSILEGKLAKKEGYILKPNMILLGDNKTQFPITTQVYQRLIELGY